MSATRWQEIRFTDGTKLELRSGTKVRPLEDGFRFRPSGEDGMAGVLVVCAMGQTVPNTDPDVEARGSELVREVYIDEVASVHGAVTKGAD